MRTNRITVSSLSRSPATSSSTTGRPPNIRRSRPTISWPPAFCAWRPIPPTGPNRISWPIEERIRVLEMQLAAKAQPYREKVLAERLSSLPEHVREDVRAATLARAESRTPLQQYLVRNFEATLNIEQKTLEARFQEFANI